MTCCIKVTSMSIQKRCNCHFETNVMMGCMHIGLKTLHNESSDRTWRLADCQWQEKFLRSVILHVNAQNLAIRAHRLCVLVQFFVLRTVIHYVTSSTLLTLCLAVIRCIAGVHEALRQLC